MFAYGVLFAAILVGLIQLYKPSLLVALSKSCVCDEKPTGNPLKDADVELHYFHSRGRAEPIRLFLEAHGVPYKDVRMSREEWLKVKHSGAYEWLQLPALYINGDVYTQSSAIMHELARRFGEAGGVDDNKWRRLNEIEGAIDDLRRAYSAVAYGYGLQSVDEFVMKTAGVWLELLEKALFKNGGAYGGGRHFVGNSWTFVDYQAYCVIDAMRALLKEKKPDFDGLKDEYPHVDGFMRMVESHGRMGRYIGSDRQPKNYNGASAKYGNQ